MATKKQDYGNDSISSLKGADRVRKRPGVIFGSDGLEGCEHAVFEILSNSIDEAREGHGSLITVTRFLDKSVQVEDMGRGCPVDWNEKEGRYNWELVFCELYAGGKYDNENSENYEFSLGLNGLGSCATQYASQYMDVTVWRGGKEYTLHFEKGENIGGLQVKELTANKKKTGTRIHWLPDLDVFTDIAVPLDYYRDAMKRQAVVNAGVTFRLLNETAAGQFDTEEFLYPRGIQDYIAELAGDDALTEPVFWEAERRGRDRADKPEYKVKLSVALCFSNRVSIVEHYHNSSFLEHGGSPEKATRLALVGAIDKYLRENNKYLKSEAKITYPDVQDCLILVSNNFSTQTSYENQTKKAITNKFVQDAMAEFLRSRLEIYFIENHDAAEKIAAQVLINKRSRETAEKTRINQKKKLTEKIDIANRVQKFVDCRTKDVERRELYIVEGDSALGACKQSRDAEFQGLMPVRGKILNCLKADYPRIFKSDVITDLMKVLGCGVEVSGKAVKDLNQFDLNNLRWNKVVICTDGDVDGFQIRTLILTMLYRLCPTLIREGKVYIAETPLFEITYKDKTAEKTWFAYSEKEKADILRSLEGKKVKIDRSKGLGENDPEMMWLTTMNPETRRLIKVLPDDVEETARVFDLLLGDNLSGRKEYIAENGHKYMDMIDVS
jgi:DNA gyrase subunit B